ncbi:glycosyltransferase family 4 protein [Acidobacteriota bacterium]
MARIGIDIRKIEDFGVGTYIQNLLENLSLIDSTNEFCLFGYDKGPVHSLDLGKNFHFIMDRSARYGVMEHVRLPLKVFRNRCHLFHSPHYVLPYFAPALPVVTIHDIIHILFPEYLPNRRALFYARKIMSRSIRQAACVLTVSERSKCDILDHFNVEPEKVRVIYNGIDESFLARVDPDERHRIKERYRLDDPFILYVGNIKPHKNVGRLIEAFALLKEDDRFKRHKLVIIGSDAARYTSIRSAVVRGCLQTEVRFLGWVPKSFLPGIYQLAECFVYPSLYEGFGFPPLEAMASQIPVVCSSASSLPEIVARAALTVDPMDTHEIAKKTAQVLTDPALRQRLVADGTENIKRFSWRDSVTRIHACYMEVLSGAKDKPSPKA